MILSQWLLLVLGWFDAIVHKKLYILHGGDDNEKIIKTYLFGTMLSSKMI